MADRSNRVGAALLGAWLLLGCGEVPEARAPAARDAAAPGDARPIDPERSGDGGPAGGGAEAAGEAPVEGGGQAVPDDGGVTRDGDGDGAGAGAEAAGAPDAPALLDAGASDSGGDACPAGGCKRPNGSACTGADQCLSGFCPGGVCCDQPCNGACQSCTLPGRAGSCTTPDFSTNVDNCGACEQRCSANHVVRACSDGRCSGRCDPGWLDCNDDRAGDGCEVDLRSDPANCGACKLTCPGTRCLGGSCEKILFTWSSQGRKAGLSCIAVHEPTEPAETGWGDNYLCTQRDFGLEWSFTGPLPNRHCLQIHEPTEAGAAWGDNYLCAPADYGLRWSAHGELPGRRCILIDEPYDPHQWDDNYLCAPP